MKTVYTNSNGEKEIYSLDGYSFREMFTSAVNRFEESVPDLNAMNVFPIPDGDTGTNMLLTMRYSMEEAASCTEDSISKVAKFIAHGSLMGARGNSGVILCQIWRGIAESLEGKQNATGRDLAEAFNRASQTAYEGINNPVEGTILTVIKEIAAACMKEDRKNYEVVSMLQVAVEAADKAVANTPNLLPVLKEAGVVDAGGRGLCVLLEGAYMYLTGKAIETQSGKPVPGSSTICADISHIKDEVPFGYCTEFLIKGNNLSSDMIRKKLKDKGQSLIVVSDDSTVKVHVHCIDPGPVIHYAVSLGTICNVSIRNMDEQYHDLLKTQEGQKAPVANIAVVSVATGKGITDVFEKLGNSVIIPGGQTMNPSTKDILLAVQSAPSDNIIILPNNKNLILVAQQVEILTKKRIAVIPTLNIPQGIAALLAFNHDSDFQTNINNMRESITMVQTIEVSRATRSTKLNGFNIKKNHSVAFLNGELLAVHDNMIEATTDILSRVDLSEAETVVIYYGADTSKTEAEKLREIVCKLDEKLMIDVIDGGQPIYNYIISVE
ncbi:MAG: DAK2 domain-containing protein [Chloroflexi bacterium]|nr:DAK2 domain-containing protein [Chloroflexota bacterium]